MKLYELSEQYRSLSDTLLEEQPQNEEALKTQLASITDQFNEKSESLGKVILEYGAENEAISKEIDRLTQRKRTFDNKAEWLKNYLQVEMQTANVDKVQGQILTISLQKSPPSCQVLNESLVPQEFIKIIPESRQISKVDILKHFRETGEVPDGVNIETNRKTLRIR
jgi:predicted nuclease with TOPRIM domain